MKKIKKSFKYVFIVLIICQTIMCVQRCCQVVYYFWSDKSMTNWAATDYLINYQGGFVRRGMFGEILYHLRLSFGIDTLSLLTVMSVVCYLLLLYLLIKSFWKRGLQLYILPLVICYGLNNVARKDSLQILLLWLILYFFLHIKSQGIKIGISMLITVFLLNLHEASLFFVWPLLSILILADDSLNKRMKVVGVVTPIATFLSLAYFKGDVATAQAIHDSWKMFLPAEWGDVPNTSVEAIGWGAKDTFLMHLRLNYFAPDLNYPWLKGWMIRPFIYIFIYYLISNYPLFFRKGDAVENHRDSIILSRILLFQFIMLIPMFTILSCDLGRIVCYWTLSSFVFYLIVPQQTLEKLFPGFYCKVSDKIYNFLRKILPPSSVLLAVIMLVITFTPVKFNVSWASSLSVIGSFQELINELLVLANIIPPS